MYEKEVCAYINNHIEAKKKKNKKKKKKKKKKKAQYWFDDDYAILKQKTCTLSTWLASGCKSIV
jgi:hypothetical protein